MSHKIVEYEQALIFTRYFLDYRTKVFGFNVTINGILLTVVLTHASTATAKLSLSVFAIIVLLISLMTEIRSIRIADEYRKVAIEIENELGLSAVTKAHGVVGEHFITLRLLFRSMYALMVLFWLFEILLVL